VRRDIFLLVLAVLTSVFGVWSAVLYWRRHTARIDRSDAAPRRGSGLEKYSEFSDLNDALSESEIQRKDAVETRTAEDKVCPTCGERYRFSRLTCPTDKSALRTLN
jgi:hypothetical protein